MPLGSNLVPSARLTVRQTVCPCPSVRPSDCASDCPPARPSAPHSVRPPIRLSVKLYVRSTVRPFVRPSVRLSARPVVRPSDFPSFDCSSELVVLPLDHRRRVLDGLARNREPKPLLRTSVRTNLLMRPVPFDATVGHCFLYLYEFVFLSPMRQILKTSSFVMVSGKYVGREERHKEGFGPTRTTAQTVLSETEVCNRTANRCSWAKLFPSRTWCHISFHGGGSTATIAPAGTPSSMAATLPEDIASRRGGAIEVLLDEVKVAVCAAAMAVNCCAPPGYSNHSLSQRTVPTAAGCWKRNTPTNVDSILAHRGISCNRTSSRCRRNTNHSGRVTCLHCTATRREVARRGSRRH